MPQTPWYAGRIYKTDIDTGTDVNADAASINEETWYADTDIWAGPGADAGAKSTTVVPMPERFSDSTSNDTTPLSFSELPCSIVSLTSRYGDGVTTKILGSVAENERRQSFLGWIKSSRSVDFNMEEELRK